MSRDKKYLQKAKDAKKDEFYTRIEDIDMEVNNYKEYFDGKVVYCNCDKFAKENDDDYESSFFKYFANNFRVLKLKQLVCTCYNPNGHGKKLVFNGIKDAERNMPIPSDFDITELVGDGSFESEECLGILGECDIVVTNPPFSLFRDFINKVVEYGKKFLVLGNNNALAYTEIFPLIKENKMWVGVTKQNSNTYFYVPKDYEYTPTYVGKKEINGEKVMQVMSISWFTNLETKKRNEEIFLYKKYNGHEENYPKYDNFDAIEVAKVKDIPCDYDGIMGVPITFMSYYCPKQFEIIGEMVTTKITETNFGYPYVNGKKKYARLLIKKINNL